MSEQAVISCRVPLRAYVMGRRRTASRKFVSSSAPNSSLQPTACGGGRARAVGRRAEIFRPSGGLD
jgi:hypothetical protein